MVATPDVNNAADLLEFARVVVRLRNILLHGFFDALLPVRLLLGTKAVHVNDVDRDNLFAHTGQRLCLSELKENSSANILFTRAYG
jgi:hypothetical protein